MSARRHLSFVAGGATLLAAAPLSSIFESWGWLVQSIVAVGLIAGAATLARMLRTPVWGQLLVTSGALLLALTWLARSGGEILGILPTPATITHFGELLNQAAEDMRSYGTPVPDRDGLIFLAVLGVGVVAVLVDLFMVGLRRPALAGLPMLAIYSVPVAVFPDSTPPVPFVVGALGFLWLLVADNVDKVRRFGRRFTGDGRDVDVWEPSPLAAAGRRLAVVGVALAVLVPVAVPGMTSGLFDRMLGGGVGSGDGGTGRVGGPGSVDLFSHLSGRLNQNQTQELIKVTTTDANPFYLRFGVADVVTPDGFRSRTPSGRAVTRGLPDPSQNVPAGVDFQRYRATVQTTKAFDLPMLPFYANPVRTGRIDSSWQFDTTMQVVFSNRSRSRDRTYEFEFLRGSYDAAALRRAPAVPTTDPNLQFATVPSVRAVELLVADLTAGTSSPYEKVLALHDYFSEENGFRYSLETRSGTSGSQIVDFLTNKTGFCEQYAAALAWLVRAAGIPARVAFGFTRGSGINGGTYTLTNRNLHAWTEAYFPGYGWLPFDATPSASVPGVAPIPWAPDPNAPSAAPSTSVSVGAGGTVDPDAPLDPDRGNQPGDPTATPFNPLNPRSTNWGWVAGSAGLIVLMLLAVPALRRNLLRRRRHALADAPVTATTLTAADTPGSPRVVVTDASAADRARRDAHAAWAELVDTMIDYRILVDPAETPRATADRLVAEQRLPIDAADGVRLIGRVEERARYARSPVAATGLGAALRTVRQTLANQAERRVRLAATFMPPSVLLRWRLGLANLAADTVEFLDRWRDILSRLSPRRLLAGRAR